MFAIGAFGHDEMQNEFGVIEFRVSDEEERSILEVVTILLDHGADINMKKLEGDFKGFTALHFASRYSSKIVQLLLSHGADPNVTSNQDNITPMCIASRRLNPHTIKALCEFGADVNYKDEEGLAPIHKIFCDLDQRRLHLAGPALQVLIEYGADVDMANEHGSTPLHIAIGRTCRWESVKDNDENYYGQKTDLAVIQQLLDANADVNKGCDEGDTPLHDAVNYLSTNLMKLLLQYNPKLSCNIYDETPLHWALKHTRDRLPVS